MIAPGPAGVPIPILPIVTYPGGYSETYNQSGLKGITIKELYTEARDFSDRIEPVSVKVAKILTKAIIIQGANAIVNWITGDDNSSTNGGSTFFYYWKC